MNMWRARPFDKCIEKIRYTPKIPKKDFQISGVYPIVSQEKDLINGYWNKREDLFCIEKPLVVFGDHTQIVKYIDFDFVLGADGVKVLQPTDDIDSRFFYYFLTSLEMKKLGYARHFRLLKEKTVPIPSLPEQKRIVAFLEEAITAIDHAKRNVENSLLNVQYLYISSLEDGFARAGSDWEYLPLSQLLARGWVKSHLDGNHGSEYPKKEEFVSSGVPYISANCIIASSVDMAQAKYLSPERAAIIRKGIAKNRDVLFAHNATVGPVAVLNTEEEKVVLGTSLTYYRCDNVKIYPEYLAHYMRSSTFVNQYSDIMRQSTRNQIPITKQRELFHIIPPLATQISIAAKLDALSAEIKKLETIYLKKLNHLEELKRSVLKKAFRGELTGGEL